MTSTTVGFAQDLIRNVETERKRISSELHDSVGQSLLLIKNKVFIDNGQNQDTKIIDDTIDEVRNISQRLHPFQFEKLGLLSLLSSVSAAEGLNLISGIDFKLKWPNDILASNKKIGGVLIETRIVNNILIAVIGIGINVNESMSDFPEEIKNMTSSLKIMIGEEFSRERVLASIVEKIESNYTKLNYICEKWNHLCGHLNKSIKFHLVNKTIIGNFIGITQVGHARMMINNKEQTINNK